MHLNDPQTSLTCDFLTIRDDITCIDHLVSTRDRWEGGQSPGAQVKVAVDGAGRGPVRGADDTVEVLHRGGDDVSHGGGLEADCRVMLSQWNTPRLAPY